MINKQIMSLLLLMSVEQHFSKTVKQSSTKVAYILCCQYTRSIFTKYIYLKYT